MRLRFDRREIIDLLVAWIGLSVAFSIFFENGLFRQLVRTPTAVDPRTILLVVAISGVTAGVGFLLHELAHKVVAVRFGQIAGFRADYGMLLLAILSAFIGFIFAAPGAVYHRGQTTARERGLIALAGPITNLVLAASFLALAVGAGTRPVLATIGEYGMLINFLLAGFNMIPFGPLDGRTVLDWNVAVFAVAFAVTAGPAVLFFFGVLP